MTASSVYYDQVLAAVLLVTCLSTYRLTRLVVEDAFPPTKAWRAWMLRRFGEDSGPAYFSTCPWCVSVYLSVPVALLALTNADRLGVQVAGLALTASAVTGLLAGYER